MTDIFVSYKSEERDKAEQLVDALSQSGYRVWRDTSLLAGSQYDTEIEKVIKRAKAVIVLWSREAIKSDWVRAEAHEASRRGIALPVRIDDVPLDDLPMVFRNAHVIDLAGWKGNSNDEAFQKLLAAVEKKMSPFQEEAKKPGLWRTISLWFKKSLREAPKWTRQQAHRTNFFLGAAASAISVLAFFGLTRPEHVVQWVSQIAGFGTFEAQLADSWDARECRRLASPLGRNTHLINVLKSQTEMNQPGLAVERCEAALEKRPDDPDLLSLTARAYFDMGDIKRAYANAQKAANSGNAYGMEILGTIEYPRGGNEDYATALENYRKAADKGNATARQYLSRMDALGLGVNKNKTTAPAQGLKKVEEAITADSPPKANCDNGVLRTDHTKSPPTSYIYCP